MKRSAIAFARGVWIGVRMIRMSAPAKTASNAAGEFAVPVADQEPEPVGAIAEIHQQVAGLLGHPGAGWVGGDPGDVHAATLVLDHDEDVEAAQEDGVDVGEVDREDRMSLGGEELSPGRTGPSRRWIEPRARQDRPDGRGGYRMAEADQLALNASVAQRGFSRTIRSTRIRSAGAVGGRPGERCG